VSPNPEIFMQNNLKLTKSDSGSEKRVSSELQWKKGSREGGVTEKHKESAQYYDK
jgi:hypothetical protein